MKVTIYTTDRGTVTVETMSDAGTASLVEAFQADPDAVLSLKLEPDAVTHINGRHIVRIDLDEEEVS